MRELCVYSPGDVAYGCHPTGASVVVGSGADGWWRARQFFSICICACNSGCTSWRRLRADERVGLRGQAFRHFRAAIAGSDCDCSVIAFFVAKETFRVRDAIGYFLAIAGGVVMIHFAPSEDENLTSDVRTHDSPCLARRSSDRTTVQVRQAQYRAGPTFVCGLGSCSSNISAKLDSSGTFRACSSPLAYSCT